ncbi:uncharacterized protein LOC144435798 [Glandiceps talaboti]
MEKQKLHDIKQWLSEIPEGQLFENMTAFPTEMGRNSKCYTGASTSAVLPNKYTANRDTILPEQGRITKYKYYGLSAFCFGLLLSLNGIVMTPLGFKGYAYWDYYPFEIFGPIFLVLGTICLLLTSFFYCKRRKLIHQTTVFKNSASVRTSVVKTRSTASSTNKQERNSYKRGGIFTLCFGILLLANGVAMTFLGVDETDSDKYYQFEIFGPTLLIFGATCVILSLFLFHNMRNVAVYGRFDFNLGKHPSERKTKSRKHNNNAKVLVTPSDGVEIALFQDVGVKSSNGENGTSKPESLASSYIWMKIDDRVL